MPAIPAAPKPPTFTTVRPGLPQLGRQPRGTARMTFPGQAPPQLVPSVPSRQGHQFPATPGAAIPPQHAPTTVTPTQPPKTSATTTVPPASPLDATYYDNLAANNLKVGNTIAGLNTQIGDLGVGLQSALAQLAYQQPRDQLALEEKANQRGALYSSGYDQQLGDLNNTYLTKQSGLTTTEAQKVGALQAQIAGLQQGVPIYQAQQYDAAVLRAAKLAAANPALGAPSGGGGTAPPAAGPPPRTAPMPAIPRTTQATGRTAVGKRSSLSALARALYASNPSLFRG